LNGKLASLNRFFSKSAEKSLPLFQTLKECIKKSDFRWTTEAEQAFQQLKKHLSALPMLATPKPQEDLIMYMSATHGAISAALLTKRGTVQTPVYFISRALQGPELNYSPMEKLVLSLVFAAKRLRIYFQAHPIAVITDQPIKQVMSRKEVTAVIEEEGPTWMTELVNYLKEGTIPEDEKEARKIRLRARYMHAGPQSVVAKAIRLGYFWPTMHKDAQDMIRKCSDCQIHRPFPEGPGKVKFLIVAMDYFTKWIEAKAVATITDGQVKKFVWDNIVCRFGIPGEIISDNGKQFTDNPFKDWCDKLNITQHFASVKHSQSNGLVERANRSLGEGIKARLGEGNKNWVEKLSHVLWAHRTMIKSSHGDTPFSLTYGTEVVIPAEIGMPTYRTTVVDVVNNDKKLHALGNGAYKLRSMDGTMLPRTWNVTNLK
nr:reverse transcriptase domain-containing protein [Tanacetum cinerariifolium]